MADCRNIALLKQDSRVCELLGAGRRMDLPEEGLVKNLFDRFNAAKEHRRQIYEKHRKRNPRSWYQDDH